MKMRTMRTAGLVGGLATGALLIAGTAAQAATDVAPVDSIGDLVMATPEALGGLPVSTDGLPVSTDGVAGLVGDVTGQVPGLNAVPVESIPGVGALVPNGGSEEAKGDKAADPVKSKDDDAKGQGKGKGQGKDDDEAPAAGDLVSDLLSGLGGGLPVPLPF